MSEVQQEEEEMTLIQTWQPLMTTIEKAVEAAIPSSPSCGSSSRDDDLEIFRTYWAGVFDDIVKTLKNSETPQYLTSPPSPRFDLHFLNGGANQCPCCFERDETPAIRLDIPGGVEDVDFVSALANYLYAPGSHVDEEKRPLIQITEHISGDNSGNKTHKVIGKRVFAPVLYHSNWMSSTGENGEKEVFGKWEGNYQVPEVWLFCCPWEEYSNMKNVDNARKLKKEEDTKKEGL